MYYNHNLRVKIQEWRNRLYKSTYHQFNNNYRFFFKNIESSTFLSSILKDAVGNSANVSEQISNAKKKLETIYGLRASEIVFKNECNQAAFFYLLNQYWLDSNDNAIELVNNFANGGREYDDQQEKFITEYIRPITDYLEDVLDDSSSILYLLEKYKIRTENFLKKSLLLKYQQLEKSYEQLLEDDLRLYLFDNGVDNPFSTPKSASGRADIVGMLDTNDPLVLEIKIVDSDKKYGKQRIIDGFNQVIKYTNDYNKNVGYLVTFVLDNIEFQIANGITDTKWPQRIEVSGKMIYLIFINLFDESTASKSKKIEQIDIDFSGNST